MIHGAGCVDLLCTLIIKQSCNFGQRDKISLGLHCNPYLLFHRENVNRSTESKTIFFFDVLCLKPNL